MRTINDSLHKQIDLDEYTKRLTNTKKRVNNVLATILAIEVRVACHDCCFDCNFL